MKELLCARRINIDTLWIKKVNAEWDTLPCNKFAHRLGPPNYERKRFYMIENECVDLFFLFCSIYSVLVELLLDELLEKVSWSYFTSEKLIFLWIEHRFYASVERNNW